MTAVLWMPMVCLITYALAVTAVHSHRAGRADRRSPTYAGSACADADIATGSTSTKGIA